MSQPADPASPAVAVAAAPAPAANPSPAHPHERWLEGQREQAEASLRAGGRRSMPSDLKSRLNQTVTELEDSTHFKAIDVVEAREPDCFKENDCNKIEIDFDRLSDETLWALHGFVEPCCCDGSQGDCVESDGAPWSSHPTKSREGWATKCKTTVDHPSRRRRSVFNGQGPLRGEGVDARRQR